MKAKKSIDTPAEQSLSDRRKGARTVRAAVQNQVNVLMIFHPEAHEALGKLNTYITSMITRDKKRKGGLWN